MEGVLIGIACSLFGILVVMIIITSCFYFNNIIKPDIKKKKLVKISRDNGVLSLRNEFIKLRDIESEYEKGE